MARDLLIGSTGDDVRNLQRLLNFHLQDAGVATLTPDGSFGQKTQAAVLRLQQLAHLAQDGSVGAMTRAALVNVGSVTAGLAGYSAEPGESVGSLRAGDLFRIAQARSSIKLPPAALALMGASPAGAPPSPSPPAPPVRIEFQSVAVQAGDQFSWNFKDLASAHSPFVIGGQANILFKLSPLRRPIAFSPGFQFFSNGVGSPNGPWTGQGFIQIGKPSLLPFGDFDLLNPFVQGFLQRNFRQSPQGGFAIGNQATWKLLGDRLGLFVNTQAVFAYDLPTGKGQPVAAQVFTGLQIDLVQLLLRK